MSRAVDGGGVATILAAVIGAIWAPWSERAKLRRQDNKVMRLMVRGDKGIPGLRDVILDMPQRVQGLEAKYKTLEDLTGKTKRGMEAVMRELKAIRQENKELKELWTVNGGTSNSPADLQYRDAQRTGTWNNDEPK